VQAVSPIHFLTIISLRCPKTPSRSLPNSKSNKTWANPRRVTPAAWLLLPRVSLPRETNGPTKIISATTTSSSTHRPSISSIKFINRIITNKLITYNSSSNSSSNNSSSSSRCRVTNSSSSKTLGSSLKKAETLVTSLGLLRSKTAFSSVMSSVLR
jgi:hypothetical protein